jgi:hypothetical protein
VYAYRRTVGAFSAAFGPSIQWPFIAVHTTTPAVRMRGDVGVGDAGTGYGGQVDVDFTQVGAQRALHLHFPQSSVSEGRITFTSPDFTGASGWNEQLFGLARGSEVRWTLYAASSAGFVPADGASLRTITQNGTITP